MADPINVRLSTLISGVETQINPFTSAALVSYNTTTVAAELASIRALATGRGTAHVVSTIADRNNLTGLQTGDTVWVTDATGDSSVKVGAALYIYNGSVWVKMAEAESMDVIVRWDDIDGRPTSTTANIDSAAAFVAALTATAADLNKVPTLASKLDGIDTGANKYVHPASGVTPGTYHRVTVDTDGHVTAGTNAVTTVAEGGTGATTAADAVTALGFTKSAAEISSAVTKSAETEVAYLGSSDTVPSTLRNGGLIIRTIA